MKRSGRPGPKSGSQAAARAEKSNSQSKPSERSLLSAYMAEIGRRGGLKGGKARAAKLSAKERKRIAIKAAKSRWSLPRRSNT